jgi:hypothetical protein
MRVTLFFLLISLSNVIYSQNQNSIWMFGDSAGIDFSNINNPQPIHSAVKSRGSCASIADSQGNLLFYTYTRASVLGPTTFIKNKLHNIILNGDSIIGEGWYNELVIIPLPGDTNRYYLFSISITGSGGLPYNNYGVYYSIIDMTQDNGNGAVIQKNVQLENWEASDCLLAVKHGNGRDWWIIAKRATYLQGTNFNEWYLYLIDTAGVHPQPLQVLGSSHSTNTSNLTLNSTNNKICFTNYYGLIEVYDFDRCSGLVTNPINIQQEYGEVLRIIGSEFSQLGQYLYITRQDTISYLYQYDLYSFNIPASRLTIDSFTAVPWAAGFIRLAPDNKIYYSCAWNDGWNYNFPYPDTVYNMYNMNLSVINDPDQPGLACNFTPFSFYLGGKRTYWGLPNNPDYELGPLAGSICDSIVGLNESDPPPKDGLLVYPNPVKDVLYFNPHTSASSVTGNFVSDHIIYNSIGDIVLTFSSHQRKVDVGHLPSGLYFLKVTTKDKVFNAKFVKAE